MSRNRPRFENNKEREKIATVVVDDIFNLNARGSESPGEIKNDDNKSDIPDVLKHTPFQQVIKLLSDREKEITVNDVFSRAILELNLLADEEKGIQSEYRWVTEKAKKSDGESKSEVNSPSKILVLYRDVRKQEQRKPNPYANWAIIGLNYIHAAINLLEVAYDNKDFDKKEFFELAHKFMYVIKGSENPEETLGRMIHSRLIPLLKKNGISPDKAEIELAQIRDFNNFYQPHFVVATHSHVDVAADYQAVHSGEHIDHLDIDVPMCGGLTKTQHDQYQRIKDFPFSAPELNNIAWYAKQPEHIKKFIKRHAQDVLDGKMISTQLRKRLAGVRNGGHEFIYVKSLKTQNNPQCIFKAHHTGNPSHDHSDFEADRENIRQLGQLTEADNIIACDLTTNLPFPGLEGGKKGVNPRTKKAVKAVKAESKKESHVSNQQQDHKEGKSFNAVEGESKQAAPHINEEKKRAFHHSALPAHQWRSLLSNKYEGVDFIREQANYIIDFLKDDAEKKEAKEKTKNASLPNKIEETLNEKKRESKLENDKLIDLRLQQKKLADLVSQYDKIKASIGRSHTDNKNNNLLLASIAAELVYEVNKLCGDNYLALVEFCKSGKDRAGLLRLLMNIHVTTQFITGQNMTEANPEQLLKVAESLARSNQIGAQAGYSGNVLGASGVLSSVKLALPAYLKQKGMPSITDKTAKYNKEIPENPDLAFYKKPKFWLGVGGTLVGAALCVSGIGAIVGAPLIASSVAIGVLGTGAVIASGATLAKKQIKKESFYKDPRFWAGIGLVVSLGLCATGIGAAIGVPIFAASVATIGSGILATIGTTVGIASIWGALQAAYAKKSSMTLAMLGMAGLGAVLCMTGIGAIIGAPLIAATITTAIASSSGAVIAGSTLLSSTSQEQTPFYKKPTFWMALGATLVGAALCATGIGAVVGAPLIATTIATVAFGTGSIMMAAPVLASKKTSKTKKVLAVLGGLVGVALCLTGIGALAGAPLLMKLGFLSTAEGTLASTATGSVGTANLVTATAVTSVAAASGTGAYFAAEATKKTTNMPKKGNAESERELYAKSISKLEERDSSTENKESNKEKPFSPVIESGRNQTDITGMLLKAKEAIAGPELRETKEAVAGSELRETKEAVAGSELREAKMPVNNPDEPVSPILEVASGRPELSTTVPADSGSRIPTLSDLADPHSPVPDLPVPDLPAPVTDSAEADESSLPKPLTLK